MAIDASTVLAVGAAAQGLGIDGPVLARSAYRTGRVAGAGPMASISFMATIAEDVEVPAGLDGGAIEVLRGAADGAPVVQSLTRGIRLHESVDVVRSGGPRRMNEFVNETLNRGIGGLARLEIAEGEELVGEPAPRWQIGAAYLGDGAAVIRHGHQPYPASGGSGTRGPTPEELLVSALASCTVFFVAHYTGFERIPYDSIEVDATARLDDGGRIVEIDRHARVVGPLTDDEAGKVEFFANHCFIGETVKRRPRFDRELVPRLDGGGTAAGLQLLYGEPASRPRDGAGCDDGSCCIPAVGKP
jgi:uncharacterized OsmC-like protein